jgi:hypothetical protein
MGATWKYHEHLSWLLKGLKKLWGTKWNKWWNYGNIENNEMMKKLLSITKIGVSITLATPFIVLLICHPCPFTFFLVNPLFVICCFLIPIEVYHHSHHPCCILMSIFLWLTLAHFIFLSLFLILKCHQCTSCFVTIVIDRYILDNYP